MVIRYLAILFVFFSLSPHVFAQVFDEDFPDADLRLFDAEIVKQSGITVAKADISIKYDREPIRDIHHTKWFEFGEGKLVRTIEIRKYRTRIDSAVVSYHRDSQGRVIFRVETRQGTTSVISRTFKNDALKGIEFYQFPKNEKWNESLTGKNLVWREEVTKEGDMFVYRNQFGKEQRSIRYQFNRRDQITENATYSHSGKIAAQHTYSYDDNGNMTSVEEKNFNKYLFDWKKEFEFGEAGQLIKVDYFRDNELKWFRKISYLSVGLPEIDITRFEEEAKLEISSIKYFTE